MQQIDLAMVPNQTFTTTIDNNRYEIGIFVVGNGMACNVTRNEEQIVSGMRIVGGQFLMPYLAGQGENGNFMLVTNNYELPTWTLFGISQQLIYISFDEILAIKAP